MAARACSLICASRESAAARTVSPGSCGRAVCDPGRNAASGPSLLTAGTVTKSPTTGWPKCGRRIVRTRTGRATLLASKPPKAGLPGLHPQCLERGVASPHSRPSALATPSRQPKPPHGPWSSTTWRHSTTAAGHSSLGHRSPPDFEDKYSPQQKLQTSTAYLKPKPLYRRKIIAPCLRVKLLLAGIYVDRDNLADVTQLRVSRLRQS